MNQKTDHKDEFNSIHYACYNGDPEVIRLLEKYGAELDVINNQQLSPMHVAAQRDQSYPLTFLQAKGLDVDCVDENG